MRIGNVPAYTDTPTTLGTGRRLAGRGALFRLRYSPRWRHWQRQADRRSCVGII